MRDQTNDLAIENQQLRDIIDSLHLDLLQTRAHLRELTDWGWGADAPPGCKNAHLDARRFLERETGGPEMPFGWEY